RRQRRQQPRDVGRRQSRQALERGIAVEPTDALGQVQGGVGRRVAVRHVNLQSNSPAKRPKPSPSDISGAARYLGQSRDCIARRTSPCRLTPRGPCPPCCLSPRWRPVPPKPTSPPPRPR